MMKIWGVLLLVLGLAGCAIYEPAPPPYPYYAYGYGYGPPYGYYGPVYAYPAPPLYGSLNFSFGHGYYHSHGW